MPNTTGIVTGVGLTDLIYLQVSDHSSVINVVPPSLKKVTCSATSSCTQGRSRLNVPFAATPVEDEMHSLVTFALMQVGRFRPDFFSF